MRSVSEHRMQMVVFLSLLTATLILSITAWKIPYFGWDVTLSQSLQTMDIPSLQTGAWLLHEFGETKAVLVMILALSGVLFFTNHRRPSILVMAILIPDILNQGLKIVIERARPDASLVQVFVESQTNSFPSGHVVHITVLLGILLYLAMSQSLSRWATIAGAFFVITIALIMGVSRIYEGSHWSSDVVGGYLWGLVYLWIMLYLYRKWINSDTMVGREQDAPELLGISPQRDCT